MKTQEAINILKEFNKWRRALPPYDEVGATIPFKGNEIGQAIEHAISRLNKAEALFNAAQSFSRSYHTSMSQKIITLYIQQLSDAVMAYEEK